MALWRYCGSWQIYCNNHTHITFIEGNNDCYPSDNSKVENDWNGGFRRGQVEYMTAKLGTINELHTSSIIIMIIACMIWYSEFLNNRMRNSILNESQKTYVE